MSSTSKKSKVKVPVITEYEQLLIPANIAFQLFFCNHSFINRFGDSPEGRLRVYQTSDIVILYLNSPLSEHGSKIWGVCNREVHAPDGDQREHAILTVGRYGK